MTSLIALCRSGYESVLCDEMTFALAQQNIAGYGQFEKSSGWLLFHCIDIDPKRKKRAESLLSSLIFARQVWWKVNELEFSDKRDRVGTVVNALGSMARPENVFADVIVEYPDTEQGKDVAKFAKKFTVPLRQTLRKKGLVAEKSKNTKKPDYLHVLMLNFDQGIVGVSIAGASKQQIGGIHRLKLPAAAPSRSTLKLEDAINTMITQDEYKRIFYPGANAVDLGACPGGWTYQLVKRGMHVEAIDNGDIDSELMASGLVEHFAVDGFTYKPAYGHVTLLVCDMIEQPDRVAALMAKWLSLGWADHAVFNLKLPMKKRFDTVNQCLDMFKRELNLDKGRYRMAAKHLYQDRDEITVCLIKADI